VYALDDHFETQRAIVAGHRVSRELRGLSASDDDVTHITY